MRYFDFSSWQGVLSTLLGLAVITLLGVGIRLLIMQTIQQRRERENRQINERLRTLIAAYKTLGGSFTGDLAVDPTHLRDLQRSADAPALRNMATAALMVTAAALQRRESRGGHYRSDFPQTDPVARRTILTLDQARAIADAATPPLERT